MCRVDIDGYVTVIERATHKARARHRCKECGRDIDPGETYQRTRGVWEGEAFTHKVCAHCCVLQDWLWRNCGGYVYSELVEDVAEHGSECGRRDLAALARLAARGWQWRGELTRVPSMPPSIGHPGERRVA